MTNSDKNITITDSILIVKASGIDDTILNDLSMPNGKSIAELLYEEKTQQENDSNTVI